MLEPASREFGLAAEQAAEVIRGEWADVISQQMRAERNFEQSRYEADVPTPLIC